MNEHWGQARGRYRPDIDGLRAIAVGLVILFHVQINGFGGGYVGVDIFFVISGYLIIGHIVSDVGSDTWSVTTFYAKRVRRLIPALAAMLAITTIIGVFLLLPSELKSLAQSETYALLGGSNIYFMNNLGYFDAPAKQQAFLHTWSLGVEEQFYLLVPLLTIAFFRIGGRRIIRAVVPLLFISFVYSVYEVRYNPDIAFYLVTSRAWELLLGGVVALSPKRVALSTWAATAVALAGLLFVLLPAHFYSESTAFPGLSAVLPCVGTAALIAAGAEQNRNVVSRLLSNRFMTFFGRISYSVYLWHWPLLFYQQYGLLNLEKLPLRVAKVITVVVILVVGAISWAIVERPTRGLWPKASARNVLTLAAAGAAIITFCAVGISASGGLPRRFSGRSLELASFLRYGGEPKLYRAGTCFVEPQTSSTFSPGTCLSYRDASSAILLVGDSHAAQLIFGLQRVMPRVTFIQATGSRCLPSADKEQFPACTNMLRFVLDRWLPSHRIARVVFASSDWAPSDAAAIEKSVVQVRRLGIPVTIVGPIPTYTQALPRLLAFEANPSRDATKAAVLGSSSEEAAAARLTDVNVRYVSLRDMLCDNLHGCIVFAAPNIPMQSDRSHLTRAGSIFVARRLFPSLIG